MSSVFTGARLVMFSALHPSLRISMSLGSMQFGGAEAPEHVQHEPDDDEVHADVEDRGADELDVTEDRDLRLDEGARQGRRTEEHRDDRAGDREDHARAEETPGAFLPRSKYGAYVVQRFRDALRASPGKLRVVRGVAASIESNAVVMLDGTRLPAEKVVLATGLAPRISRTGRLPDDGRIVDAWDEVALAA